MSGTKLTPLRRLVSCLDGRRIPLNAEERSTMLGSVPYWGAGSIVDYVDRPLFDEPIVLLGEDGAPFFDPTRDVAFVVNEPVWVNNHIHVLRTNHRLDDRYLAHALNVVDYSAYINGSTRDKLTQEQMMSIQIPLPPLSEQAQIARFLDDQTTRIDQIIVARQQQIGLLQEGLASSVEQTLSALRGGRVALSWVLAAGVQDGPHETPEFIDEGVPFLSVDSIVADEVNFAGTRFISAEEHERFARKCRPQRGDVLLTKAASVGKVALVETDIDFNIWSPIAVLRPRQHAITPPFLAWSLRSADAQMQMALASTNSTQNNLAMRDIAALRVTLPSLDAQMQAVATLNRIKAEVRTGQASLNVSVDLLQEFKRSLISAAVSGEFDVTTASGRGVPA